MSAITNENGQLRSAVGHYAIQAVRLRTVMVGLKFEFEHKGMRMTRGRSMKAVAKDITGLRTNNVVALLVALQGMLDAALAQCTIVTDGNVHDPDTSNGLG